MAKTAIITGSAGGIGAAAARLFTQKEYNVVLADKDRANLKQIYDELEEIRKGGAHMVVIDLSDTSDIPRLVKEAVEVFDRIDVLVNSAGAMLKGNIEDVTNEETDTIFAVNVKAPMFLIQEALPFIKKSKGAIVNISSVVSTRQTNQSLLYAMTKAALDHMSVTLAGNLAADGVRVNTVNPGGVLTGLWKKAYGVTEETLQSVTEELKEIQPMGILLPQEVARLIWTCADPDLPSLTGQQIGLTAGIHIPKPWVNPY